MLHTCRRCSNTLPLQQQQYQHSHASLQGRHLAHAVQHATLMVRPRGWHLPEKHILVDGQTSSGALMDFAIFFFNSAQALVKGGSGEQTNVWHM